MDALGLKKCTREVWGSKKSSNNLGLGRVRSRIWISIGFPIVNSWFWSKMMGFCCFLMKMSLKYEGIRVLIRGCQTSFLSPKLREWIFMIVNHHTIPGKLQLSDIN